MEGQNAGRAGQSPGGGLGGVPRGRPGYALLGLGPFPLVAIGQQIPIVPSGHYGGPDQMGQVVLYNYSNFILQIYDTQTGTRLDLQALMGNVYDPPAGGAQLYARIAQGTAAGGLPNVLTGQAALMGEQIPGAWPVFIQVPGGGGGGGGAITLTPGPGIAITSP